MAADDEVIRRKLLIDGDGTGDDRRVTFLLRSFIQWCMSNESEEESKVTYERLLATLAQCEYTMSKSRITNAMNQAEMQNYETLCKHIEESIATAHKKITVCKEELQQAKRIRKNRQEYDVLAKVIEQHPDRQETTRKLTDLDKQLSELQKTKTTLEDKLDIRRKQFQVLLSSIYELQQLLEGDEGEDAKSPMDTSYD